MAKKAAKTPAYDAPKRPKQRSDVYVGLLAIALLAQIAGAVFLYLDYQQYPAAKPQAPVMQGPQGGVTK
jgi:hypothetical protein